MAWSSVISFAMEPSEEIFPMQVHGVVAALVKSEGLLLRALGLEHTMVALTGLE